MSAKINDDAMKFFSENVSQLRKSYNISKKEMAQILGVGIKTLDNIERGMLPLRLSVNVLFKIRDCFGISVGAQFSEKMGNK